MIDLSPLLQRNIDSSFLFSLFISYMGGFLTSLSPCIYPLIPIVSSFVASNCIGERTKKKAFFLSLIYVLGVSIVYSIFGLISALTGTLFGSISNNPWTMIGIANLIILMAFIMLDIIPFSGIFFDIKTSKKGFLGAFVLGASSAFIISPCTLPVLGVILMYIATKQNFFSGALLMLSFSLGMSTLLLLIGTFSGIITSLPKPGEWMLIVKKILAIVMIILAEYFLIKAGMMFY